MALFISSCKHQENEYHSITDKIEAKSKDYHGVSVSSEPYFGDIDLIKISEDGQSFLIPERKGNIKSYACTECHTKPLKQMQSKDLKKAHWNISIKHAGANTMNCITCHSSNNMDDLHSLTGSKIDFNKSYKLCSQCHTEQFKDWKGGAHGKQIGGWAPPRASLTCVNCHNPHNPAFSSKWPARFNTQKIKERK
ncbi:MAG: cytochrome c3 family protein [Polaribacter sp.]|nr:cytochrome c3 family protein [Polaribacter sp.]